MSATLRLEIGETAPLAAGRAFGERGAYERLSGVAHFALDPRAAAYRGVVDLDLAPVNAAGQVEFSAEFCILRPADWARGNRRIVFDVINRGNVRALQFFNDAEPSNAPSSDAHAGNGFLMRRGYTLVALAWQGDILPGVDRMSMRLPIAGSSAQPVTAAVRMEFIADAAGTRTIGLSGNDYTHSYPTASLDQAQARFTRRQYAHEARLPIPASEWAFARLDAQGRLEPSATHCTLHEGFRPGWIYELIYTAKDPLVLGLGFAGVRDFLSFLRYGTRDAGGMANPVATKDAPVERVYGWGRSQSGRFLREFVYRGWNEDAALRRVFDGVHPHVTGAGRVTLNYRFAQPGRYPRQHEDHLVASDQFPFAYGLSSDPFSARTDAILRRPNSDPLVIHSQTAAEYWQRRGSLVHTDAFGADLAEHPRARVFLFASSQHFAPPGGEAEQGAHRHRSNPLDTAPLLRALLDMLDAWATHGTEPVPSRVPRRSDATLVSAAQYRAAFPSIPGVEAPHAANRLHRTDYGTEVEQGRFTLEPPQERAHEEYAVLVPRADADGNDIAGVRTPQLEAPLATYTGWNYRAAGSTQALYSIVGSYLPFATNATERANSGDPRPSLAERYRSRYDYIARVAIAAHTLVQARLLLAEDLDRYVARAIAQAEIV
ncbi:MAG: hypothetical protein IT531_13655 [Burkholderiales bacterium]|nr:hypothetical protein [Burkholderiales bacterium]